MFFNNSFGEHDLYFQYKKNKSILDRGNNMLNIREKNKIQNLNSSVFVNFLHLYGSIIPKEDTLNKKIIRLGSDQVIKIYKKKVSVIRINKELNKIKKYKEKKHLNKYYKIFDHSLRLCSSDKRNWVLFSGGWDSTAILGQLKKIYNKETLIAVFAKIKYSKKIGYVNLNDLNTVKKITSKLSVPLKIINIDYTNPVIQKKSDRFLNTLRNNHIFTLMALNWLHIGNEIKKLGGGKSDTIITGEFSDGAHNFGFSQSSIFLDDANLKTREYGDKLSSYLFGPTFFE